MSIRYVKRYGPFDRVCHWTLAVSFIVLVLTGLGLYDRTFGTLMDLMGGGVAAIRTHKIAGVIFVLSSVVMSLMHLKDSLTFDSDDAKWLQVLGGYLSRDAEEPPMGKYNTGQKLFDLFSLAATIGLAVTGWVLWDPAAFGLGALRTSLALHSLLFALMVAGVVVHIYLGTVGNPGTLPGMLYGEVSEAWAKKHSPKWLAKLKGNL